MSRPQWILALSPHFSDPARLRPFLANPIVLTPAQLSGTAPMPVLAPGRPRVAFGTMHHMMALLRHPVLGDAVLDRHVALRCSQYYRHVYPHLGQAMVLAPVAALGHLPLQRMFGASVFVRPDGNNKPFEAEVLPTDPERVADCARRLQHHSDRLIVLSEVIDPGTEYRCFVRRGRVFAHSSYPRQPHVPAPPAVTAFAEAVAADLAGTGMTMLTVDVSLSGERLRLVEVGGVNSWGLYGAREEDFVAGMEAEARQAHDELWG